MIAWTYHILTDFSSQIPSIDGPWFLVLNTVCAQAIQLAYISYWFWQPRSNLLADPVWLDRDCVVKEAQGMPRH